MPLGVANEALETFDPANPRREDHVGHKIEWENDVPMRVNAGVASAILRVTCDVMIKLHQGTHSKDAFTNNLHEMVYHIRCHDGSEAHLTFMAAIGTPGEFLRSCNQEQSVRSAQRRRRTRLTAAAGASSRTRRACSSSSS